jgi:hypothetical protein
VAREDYRRVERAATSRGWWLYLVLTFDPSQWENPWKAYKDAARLWDKRLRRMLERAYGRLDYLQTWERTRRGWPHLNLLLRSDALQDHVRSLVDRRVWIQEGDHGRGRLAHATGWRPWIADRAPRAGFGKRVWVEIVDNKAAMGAYLVKVATEFSRSAFKDGDQRPLGAPPHFRRIRASRGLLPPRMKLDVIRRVDRATGEVSYALREVPADTKSQTTAVLLNRPFAEFEDGAGWTDVGEARALQYAVAKKRAARGPRLARIEYEG